MTFVKTTALKVLGAHIGAFPTVAGDAFHRTAKRWAPHYEPKPGMLYVRSRAISSRTNDNFDTFPAEEIRKSWQTFIGKPVFVNHHNADHRRARGVNIDATLHEDVTPDGKPDTWVETLMEIDAVTFPQLAQAIIEGRIDRTSMGCSVAVSTCSFCGNRAEDASQFCRHIPAMKGKRISRKKADGSGFESVLVHEICEGLNFFENSLLVEDPADPTAFAWVDFDCSGLAKAASATLDSLNPSANGVFADYDPRSRATLPLGPSLTTLAETQGVPADTRLVIYRGAPVGQTEIVPGDFVTTNRMLAQDYAGDGNVLSLAVTYGDVLDDRDEPGGEEYIYRPAGRTASKPSTAALAPVRWRGPVKVSRRDLEVNEPSLVDVVRQGQVSERYDRDEPSVRTAARDEAWLAGLTWETLGPSGPWVAGGVRATHPDGGYGYLLWMKDGEIRYVEVDEAHRRKGLATELFRRAKEAKPDLHHSNQLNEHSRPWAATVASAWPEMPREASMAQAPDLLQTEWEVLLDQPRLPLRTLRDIAREHLARAGYQRADQVEVFGDMTISHGGETRLNPLLADYLVPEIVLSPMAMNAVGVLHEVAHVINVGYPWVPEDDGHGPAWRALYARLLRDEGVGGAQALLAALEGRTASLEPREAYNPHRIGSHDEEKDVTLKGGTQARLYYWSSPSWSQAVQALTPGGAEMGYLTWARGTIDGVHVKPRYRRKGLATAMLEFARTFEPDLAHSHALLPDGAAWAEKVGSASGLTPQQEAHIRDARDYAVSTAAAEQFTHLVGFHDEMKTGAHTAAWEIVEQTWGQDRAVVARDPGKGLPPDENNELGPDEVGIITYLLVGDEVHIGWRATRGWDWVGDGDYTGRGVQTALQDWLHARYPDRTIISDPEEMSVDAHDFWLSYTRRRPGARWELGTHGPLGRSRTAKVHVPDDPARYGDTSIRYELGGTKVMDPRDLPSTVYHVTTAGSRIGSVLLADFEKGGGLGGDSGEDRSVSFTTSQEVATEISEAMAIMAAAARRFTEIGGGRAFFDYLNEAAQEDGWTFEGDGRGWMSTYDDYAFGDWMSLWFSGRAYRGRKRNPLFFGVKVEKWASVDPADVGYVTASRQDIIDSGAMVTDFDLGQRGLEEIRVWGDVKVGGFTRAASLRADERHHFISSLDKAAQEYWTSHRPGSDGPPLHDLLEGDFAPRDVYDNPHYYTGFTDLLPATRRVIEDVRDRPSATVTIYRSLPPNVPQVFNTGDWVSLSEEYARMHGTGRGWEEWVEPAVEGVYGPDEGWVVHEGDWPVISVQVPASAVRWDVNDLMEWGYHGPTLSNVRTAMSVGDKTATYFHGSDREFSPGDLILPAAETGAPNWAEQLGHDGELGPHYDPGQVYVSDTSYDAGVFGKHVYEVEPEGEIEIDPESAHLIPGYAGQPVWSRSPRARVIRKVSTTKTAMPDESGYWYHFGSSMIRTEYGHYVHLGTREAAEKRHAARHGEGNFRHEDMLLRARISPRNPLGSPTRPMTDHEANALTLWEKDFAQEMGEMPGPDNGGDELHMGYNLDGTPAQIAARWNYQGAWKHDAFFYRNDVEDKGSISVAADSNVIYDDEIAPPTNESVGEGQLLLWGSRARASLDKGAAVVPFDGETIYRGLAIPWDHLEIVTGLTPEDFDTEDGQRIATDLVQVFDGTGAGRHWSTVYNVSYKFAHENAAQIDGLPVVLEATYREGMAVEDDEVLLDEWGVETDPRNPEKEVTLHESEGVTVNKVYWGVSGWREAVPESWGNMVSVASLREPEASRSRGIDYADAWAANEPSFQVVSDVPPMIGGDWEGHTFLARASMSWTDALDPGRFLDDLLADARANHFFKDATTLYLVVSGRGRDGQHEHWVVGEMPAGGSSWSPSRTSMSGRYGRRAVPDARFLNAVSYSRGEEARKWIGENIAGVVTDEEMFEDLAQEVVVYRGISLAPDQDPTTATKGNGSDLGSSWTTSLDAAQAIAERGMAGFTGAQVLGDTHLVPRSRPYVPTVLRATVRLLPPEQGGAAPYRPWTIDYASEAEIDIPRGTEIVVDGIMQAQGQVRGSEGDNDLVTWSWGRSWRSVNLRRTASGLTLEDYISVAEEAVERTHPLAGRRWVMPRKADYPRAYENDEFWAAMEPVTKFVREVLASEGKQMHEWFRVDADGWHVTQMGVQGATDGLNWIDLRNPATTLTILHECAHVIRGTGEGAGHDKAFVETLARLLSRYVSPAAAEQFLHLVGFHEEMKREGGLHPHARRATPMAEHTAVSSWKRTPGGQYSYRTSVVGKNGTTYYITGSFESFSAFVETYSERLGEWVREPVGKMHLWTFPGHWEIHQVSVNPEHRRQGVASAMLDLAREFHPDVVHSGPGALSPDGAAWAAAYASLTTTAGLTASAEREIVVSAEGHLWTWRCSVCGEGPPNRGYRDKDKATEYGRTHAQWCWDLGWDDEPMIREAARDEAFLAEITWRQQGRLSGYGVKLMARHPDQDPGKVGVGYILFTEDSIENLWVDPRFRRKGLASEMLRRAREIAPTLKHGPVFSDEGLAWARSQGFTGDVVDTGEEYRWKTASLRTASADEVTYRMRTPEQEPWILDDRTMIQARIGETEVGWLLWDERHGGPIIEDIWVHEDHRRKGIATRMLQEARQIEPDLEHSWMLTDDGSAWMRAVEGI